MLQIHPHRLWRAIASESIALVQVMGQLREVAEAKTVFTRQEPQHIEHTPLYERTVAAHQPALHLAVVRDVEEKAHKGLSRRRHDKLVFDGIFVDDQANEAQVLGSPLPRFLVVWHFAQEA